MALFIKDTDGQEGVQFLAGKESVGLGEDFFTFSTVREESNGSLTPVDMFKWGYNFSVEEAREIHKLLGEALEAEDSIK